jgi:hypothetical protein
MSIEKSHGKARPTLPRSSDLQPVGTVGDRHRGRDERGRVTTGNTLARDRGWRASIRKLLGRETTDPIATVVAEDAWRIFSATIRELPSDGATVRGLVAAGARHQALAAFWNAQAIERGLATDEGVAAQEQATKHDTRAERLAVTALDIATRLANADAKSKPNELLNFIATGEK